jgi:hypothetical protein
MQTPQPPAKPSFWWSPRPLHLGLHAPPHAQDQIRLVKGKVVSVFFLDIKGAFPNADVDQLLHNMRQRHVPEPYI